MNHAFPATYHEALVLLSKQNWTIMGGGTDLMVKHRRGPGRLPEFQAPILFTDGLLELDYMDELQGKIHIGAKMTLENVLDHFHTPQILREAIATIGSPGIRHRATLVGNLVNASPAGDSLPPLYILDALVVVESVEGIRHIPIEDFILGPGQVALGPMEMVKEVVIPTKKLQKAGFIKVGARKADTITKISLAYCYEIKKKEVVDFRLAFGAVGKTVIRPKAAEVMVLNHDMRWLKDHKEDLVKAFCQAIHPIDDQRSSASYRLGVARNLVGDLLNKIAH